MPNFPGHRAGSWPEIKLIFSGTLQGREEQIELKKYIQEIDKLLS
jgi:hypothetical protein